jgi:hypothetical protein
LKKIAWLFVVCMAFAACSKAPGSKETGFDGMPWGSDVATVAKTLNVAPNAVAAGSLFEAYYQDSAPRQGVLMEQGLAKFLTGKSGADLDGVAALKGMTMLNGGKNGYSLFFNGKFGMHVRPIPATAFQADHGKLMKRYGVIDKKVEFMANEYESAYFIQWHDADGVILLAKEVAMTGPPHQTVTTAQIIHIDKRVFDAIAGELSK